MQRTKPAVHHRRTVARSRLFEVEEMHLEFSNGVHARYERLLSSGRGAVVIAPMLDAETVLLIREYAAGTHRYELGLPKGRIEADEDILAAADREIMEEIGFGSRRLSHLGSFSLAPGYMSHTSHLVLAQDLYEHRVPGDEPEEIEVLPWRLADLGRLLEREDCSEARSIAALFMVRERLLAAAS
ncbi:ADP compounds hydrolase NudE [Thioalkalivibrio nitratireducens DSM 14787]|uniref:ADP compounds hydrolase NudE n=1 Tax=Thioalkalivibrio nitratireducens (strain DSM 14787 / UNIQEM 213 / ALEN2) TaxID=1255043 RepID=L0DSP0_THIND|nr:ADP compounds hydrolase NudE [Thioalkalivibrio nitratireducens]AGA32000.1 ADP compounds hydrolase NudE [Thioalkalivibrio nitratireducens DSM 14787]